MSVIVELSLPATEFHLGLILGMEGDTRIVLEKVVPLGDKSVPLIRVFEGRDDFESVIGQDPAVEEIRVVAEHDEEILYALDWDISDDEFFEGVLEHDGTINRAMGTERMWTFELQFEEHEQLSAFQQFCVDREIDVSCNRLYNPTTPDAGPWYGLTAPQRTALLRAVEEGYYSIPRDISTEQLADLFGISDQAMSERLRRGVINLVKNTIQVSHQVQQNPN